MKLSQLILVACVAFAPARAFAQITTAAGFVVDSVTGRPIGNVLLSLTGNGYAQTVSAGDAGIFRFTRVTPGTYTLAAKKLGYAPTEVSIPIEDNGVRIRVGLVRIAALDTVVARLGTGISGEVGTLKSLLPLANADLMIVGTGTRAKTDSSGRFFIPLRGPGTYVVRARRSGYAPVALSVVVERDSAPRLMLLLDTASTASTNAHEIAWQEFGDRARLRGAKSAIVSHAELASTGEAGLVEALQRAPSVSSKQLRFGQTVCVFVDGRPMAGTPLRGWDVEQVEAVEVYTSDARSDGTNTLRNASRGYECQSTQLDDILAQPRDRIRWLVIWLRR